MKPMTNPVATLALTVLANAACTSLLLFALLVPNPDHRQHSDAVRNRIDVFVEYIDTKTNRISEKQDNLSNGIDDRMRVLESRVNLLQGRCQ